MPTSTSRRRHLVAPLLALLALLSGAGGLGAQRVQLGGAFGVSASTQQHRAGGAPTLSAGRMGAAGGLAVRVQLVPALALQGEMLYVEKGFDQGPDFAMEMAYLQFPVLLRAEVPRTLGPGVRPLLTLGLAPALEVSCGGRALPPHLPEEPPGPVRPLDCDAMRTERRDLDALLGAGLTLRAGVWTLTAEARHLRGLRDIGRGFESVTVRNRATLLLLGAALPVREAR